MDININYSNSLFNIEIKIFLSEYHNKIILFKFIAFTTETSLSLF